MNQSEHVAVVVLNWNRAQDTLRCVGSVTQSRWPQITTIVVDNASDEPLEPLLQERYPQVILLQNEANLGFGGGMNVGLAHALEIGAGYVLLLNNDTIVDPDMISLLVEAAHVHSDAGIISPLVLNRDAPDRVMSAGARFDPRRGHPGRSELSGQTADDHLHGTRVVQASSGEAMFVSAKVVRRVGPLDSELYLRLEDIDWSLRMRAAGLRNYVALDAHLLHEGSASSGGEHSALNAYYHTRNILTVCARHAPMGPVRGSLREAEVLLANVVHARRGERPLANARAAIAGWGDFRRGKRGAREIPRGKRSTREIPSGERSAR